LASEIWAVGEAYEAYIGRWSRAVAQVFVSWLSEPSGRRWLDVGCGTGALAAAILELAEPVSATGVDPSHGFVEHARTAARDTRAAFLQGDAEALPVEDGSFDVVVSGLVINFVPDPRRAVAEMARVTRTGGTIAAYVWDYADGMQLIRRFWDAAGRLDPAAATLDEGTRFPLCRPQPLEHLFREAGLVETRIGAIEVPTVFRDFEDFWTPFLGGQGPAPSYLVSLDDARRESLRESLRDSLPLAADGSIELTARAWAVRGSRL
jgi:SAM-dependent methyltransferase